jgi:hypothetical protein
VILAALRILSEGGRGRHHEQRNDTDNHPLHPVLRFMTNRVRQYELGPQAGARTSRYEASWAVSRSQADAGVGAGRRATHDAVPENGQV